MIYKRSVLFFYKIKIILQRRNSGDEENRETSEDEMSITVNSIMNIGDALVVISESIGLESLNVLKFINDSYVVMYKLKNEIRETFETTSNNIVKRC